MRIVYSPAVLLTALLLGCSTADVGTDRTGAANTITPPDTRRMQDAQEWLVKLRPGITTEQLVTLYKPAGLFEIKPIASDLVLLRFAPEAQLTETRIREIGGDTLLYVQPNYTYHTF